MAPEQAAADRHTDHRADIYAFGVLAYELLGRTAPVRGSDGAGGAGGTGDAWRRTR